MSRRHTLKTAAGAAATLTIAAAPPAAASAAGPGAGQGQAGRPTVVLVHGAFADAASWNPVTERLQQYGHPVVVVANPLRGLTHDAAQVAARLAAVPGPVVLVGHSYGGAVITQAAATAPTVKALVYVSAFVPDAGEVLGELAARFPGSQLEASLDPVPVPGPAGTTGVDLYIRPDRYHEVFAQDVPRTTTRVLAAGQRPLSGSAFTDRVSGAAWHTVPSWTLISTRDRGIVPELQRFQASRARSRTVEVPSSHLPMYSRPDAVVALIRSAARTIAA
ncbi:alpha/beta fold hydrolase [Streptomyces sp. NBC_01294]|uniref:alpha/beta fold hydrolase n=1 Tax=Streptomyces sp. NBC_01294 TaxID=2903815 RepID=UPI002DDB98BE|nr:alpha/beta hydrolase [Streptomyces sp. NBC_01294]WRZ60781.1 alpha/beta hydrolase [Streptomyces sp. NBC_01294]